MSAWRIGTGGGTAVGALEEEKGDLGKYVDAVAKWIPGDIVAFYLAAITLITGNPLTAPPDVSLWLAATAATAVLIFVAARRMKRTWKDTLLRVALGVCAFLVWSAVIPQSGWAAWRWAAEHPRSMTVYAALAGIVFCEVADWLVGRD
ncbi:MAG: hypothetical protein ACLPXZ_20625 [Mycobacterium sp.]